MRLYARTRSGFGWTVAPSSGDVASSSSMNPIEMIKENLIAERIACDHYRELIRFFADKGPTTRVMMEHILTNEEEHANDMLDLLAGHGESPNLTRKTK